MIARPDGSATGSPDDVCRPVILDPSSAADAAELARLRADGAVREEHDTIAAQLLDLVRVRAPALPEPERARAVEELLGGRPVAELGRQVYFPWSGRLVHLLPPAEFDEVRLDRNRHKVTRAEQARLRQATVAVVGLSVGNAVALTLAQEGACGRLVLADFDRLDLSNMNRLRAGVHEIGLPKTVIAARQIAEIDPYLEVVTWPEGVREEEVDALLAGPPRLDVLVDECDGLLLKFLMRACARAHRVPVVMETSDRGMLDVERFDLEPGRPLFHGLVPELSPEVLRAPDLATRARVVLDVIGGATMSARFGASLAEIGRTICSWPQLASDVALGGASVTVAVRKILLGEPLPSGRKLVDLQDVAAHDARTVRPPRGGDRPAPLPARGLAHAEGEGTEPEHPVTRHALAHAALAPSAGNAQPWHFHHEGATAWIRLDVERARRRLDPADHAALLAIGAAVENALVAAAQAGNRTDVLPFPLADRPDVVARLDFAPDAGAAAGDDARLFPFVASRCTNRRPGQHAPLPEGARNAIVEAARLHGATLDVVEEAGALAEIGAVAAEAERLYVLALHAEAAGDLRLGPEDVAGTWDGIDAATLELDPFTRAVLQVACRTDVSAALRGMDGGQMLGATLGRAVAEGTAAVALLRIADDAPASWLQGGRALQRLWLTAASLGIALQPLAGALALAGAVRDGAAQGLLTASERASAAAIGTRLAACFPTSGDVPVTMVRLFEAQAPSARERRLPLARLASHGAP